MQFVRFLGWKRLLGWVHCCSELLYPSEATSDQSNVLRRLGPSGTTLVARSVGAAREPPLQLTFRSPKKARPLEEVIAVAAQAEQA